jgi:CPA2 family monovalent cation:H+ antiporter-2
MRDAFAVLFFVSVGRLLDPVALLDNPALVLGALLVVVVAKPLVAAIVIGLSGYPLRTAVAVPAALAQIGEFSFILAAAGRELGILPEAATNIIVAVSITSIVVNPPLSKLIVPVEQWIARWRGGRAGDGELQDQGALSTLDPQARAIVVGYGPTGRTVTRLLRENQISPTVVELNVESVRTLREQGISAIHGDARYPDTLISAGLRHAGTLIVSGADAGSPDVIARARDLNPGIHIFVRGTYLRDVPLLRSAGAEQVFSGEGEVALAMTEAVLRRLGATPDQIDRERARVRAELVIPETSGSAPGSSGSGSPENQDAAVHAALVNRHP